jgi:hypothetical protein
MQPYVKQRVWILKAFQYALPFFLLALQISPQQSHSFSSWRNVILATTISPSATLMQNKASGNFSHANAHKKYTRTQLLLTRVCGSDVHQKVTRSLSRPGALLAMRPEPFVKLPSACA